MRRFLTWLAGLLARLAAIYVLIHLAVAATDAGLLWADQDPDSYATWGMVAGIVYALGLQLVEDVIADWLAARRARRLARALRSRLREQGDRARRLHPTNHDR